MEPRSQTRVRRAIAPALAAAVTFVWLVGGCLAFAASIEAAQHACCQQAPDADACLALCAAESAPTVAPAPAPFEAAAPAPVAVLAAPAAPAPLDAPAGPPAGSSPPPLLEHVQLLI